MNWLSDNRVKQLLDVLNSSDLDGTRYRVIRELGRGGMGTVYLAEDTELGRYVALKVLNGFESNSDLATRMRREAKIMARLEHPGIVPVHDVGTLADGRVFYAMKLVRGRRLDEYTAETDSLKDRLRKFQSACEAVAFAHAQGVIHRDLKPQNIMIGPFGEVLVLDWGVAKIQRAMEEVAPPPGTLGQAVRTHAIDETSHGTIIGTPGYMSPEQARGEIAELNQRSDVYALGAILYFLLTNRSPAADDRSALPRPRELNRTITKPAEAVCLKAMSASNAERYADANELAADVVSLIDNEPVSAYRESVLERVVRWLSKNRWLVFLILAYLLTRILLILTSRN